MVPSGKLVVDVRVVPLFGIKIKSDSICELRFGVPTTINVELAANSKHGVASSAFWRIICRLNLRPGISLEIENK
jgi:hypothetical protein